MKPKNPPIGLRLSDEDRKKLDELMKHHGWDQSNILRWLIREEFKRISVTIASSPKPANAPEPEGF